MTVVISMLRAVNVGGRNTIKMDALRALYESLKLRNPQTYVQSGNVVFGTEERNLVRLTRRIENGIERTFGFRPDVILRTVAELRDVVESNPFATRRGIEPSKLLVTFFGGDPGAAARAKVLAINTKPEELWIDGREMFIHFPNGMGRSRLPFAAIQKTLNTAGTARNWNSVTRLLEMADRLADQLATSSRVPPSRR